MISYLRAENMAMIDFAQDVLDGKTLPFTAFYILAEKIFEVK